MTTFRDLHRSGLLILPNAWDAASAVIVRAAGAKAVATTSAGVAWALGYPDGASPPKHLLVEAVARIVAVAGVPVSADIEGGFSDDPAEAAAFVAAMVGAGAVGINIEDGAGSAEALAVKIAAIRAALGPDLFINARCDLWLRGIGPAETRMDEAQRRAALYRDAGADGLFMPGVVDAPTIRALVSIGMPLNLLARHNLPGAAELETLGVRRLSAGSNLAAAAYRTTDMLTREFLADGRSEPQIAAAMDYGALNALMTPRP